MFNRIDEGRISHAAERHSGRDRYQDGDGATCSPQHLENAWTPRLRLDAGFPFHPFLVCVCDSHGGFFPAWQDLDQDGQNHLHRPSSLVVVEKPSGFFKFCGMDDYLNRMENPFRK
jgi:hypothetical protein